MAELKIDVQDLHKSYGQNEVLKGLMPNSTKAMSFVSLVLLVLENRPFSVPSIFLKVLLAVRLWSTVLNYQTLKQILTRRVKISGWCSNISTFSLT